MRSQTIFDFNVYAPGAQNPKQPRIRTPTGFTLNFRSTVDYIQFFTLYKTTLSELANNSLLVANFEKIGF